MTCRVCRIPFAVRGTHLEHFLSKGPVARGGPQRRPPRPAMGRRRLRAVMRRGKGAFVAGLVPCHARPRTGRAHCDTLARTMREAGDLHIALLFHVPLPPHLLLQSLRPFYMYRKLGVEMPDISHLDRPLLAFGTQAHRHRPRDTR